MKEAEILLIEDNERDSKHLMGLLKQAGYTSIWNTDNIKEGFELIKQRNFSVIITELMFSIKNSDLIKQLMMIRPFASIVIISPYNLISKAIFAMEEGAFGYITKPFNSSEIRIILEHALEHCYLKGQAGEKKHFFELSIIDGLTGLYNHRHFYEILEDEFRKLNQYPHHISLLMIDIDNFKDYNDKYGHQAGDALLKDLADLINNAIRKSDMAFRYGGEEFIIFLSQAKKEETCLVSERILGSVRLHLPVTISMGIASFPEDADNATGLVKRTDEFLYKAKELGKDRICFG